MFIEDLLDDFEDLASEGVIAQQHGELVGVHVTKADLRCTIDAEPIVMTDIVLSPLGGQALRLWSVESGALGCFAIVSGDDVAFAPCQRTPPWETARHIDLKVQDLPPIVSWSEVLRELHDLEQLAPEGDEVPLDLLLGKIIAVRYFLSGATRHLGIDISQAEERWKQMRDSLP